MTKFKKILAIIPARGGSKGIPHKNIKLLNGKPLISYAIKAALKSKLINRIIVSTDDKEIAKIAKKYGAEIPFIRPVNLATDKVPTLPVLQHTVNFLKNRDGYRPDLVVLLQPTVPLMLTGDIDRAINRLIETKTNSCVSVCEISERPERMYVAEKNGIKIKPFLKKETKKGEKGRQVLPKIFKLNGAIYINRTENIIEKNKIIDKNNLSSIVMPKERSVDIDDPIDFYIIETIIKKNNFNLK